MSESVSGAPGPALTLPARVAGVVVGLLTLVAGGVAVFRTDNELGSTALVTAGVVIAGLGVFGNRIEAVEAAGVRLELQRQARRAREQAEQARATGEVDRAEELERHAQSLLAAASAVGSRYERLRTTEPAGWQRTSRMEGVLREARAIDTEGLAASDVAGIFSSGSDGNRIVALALVERRPALATADLLVDAIVHSRSTFEQYHALVAAESSLDHLSAEERRRVLAAVESVLAGPLGEKSSDRRTVARRLLERLTAGSGD
jgi:hypothetical protein